MLDLENTLMQAPPQREGVYSDIRVGNYKLEIRNGRIVRCTPVKRPLQPGCYRNIQEIVVGEDGEIKSIVQGPDASIGFLSMATG